MSDSDERLPPEHQLFAIKTWRYLRLALVALVVGLIVSVAYERWWAYKDSAAYGHAKKLCWQTSLSAYYYTPVHGYFVSALVAMGVCMFCLKGTSSVEDLLLDIGGVSAVIVGLVPTPKPGLCGSVLGTTTDRPRNRGGAALRLRHGRRLRQRLEQRGLTRTIPRPVRRDLLAHGGFCGCCRVFPSHGI